MLIGGLVLGPAPLRRHRLFVKGFQWTEGVSATLCLLRFGTVNPGVDHRKVAELGRLSAGVLFSSALALERPSGALAVTLMVTASTGAGWHWSAFNPRKPG